MAAHLYIHIPFCLSKCSYCSFVSFPGMNHLFGRYVRALCRELRLLAVSSPPDVLDSIFLGGGTPSLLSVEDIARILRVCREVYGIDAQQAEVSMEMNPRTVDFIKLLSLKELGINRVSIGVQSFSDTELQRLGRLHSAQDAYEAVASAWDAGFATLNLDLMSGIPGQTVAGWRWNLQTALGLGTHHLSLYQLSVEDGTGFSDQSKQGRLILPDEDAIQGMDEVTAELCAAAGFRQYEISNFAKPGFECRHNLNCWRNGAYLGVGAGAVRSLAGARTRNIDNPLAYCEHLERGELAVAEKEILDAEASFRETVVLGLRMNAGVSSQRLFDRYGIDLKLYYGRVLDRLLEWSLVEFHGSCLCLTARGRMLANRVMAELV